MIALPLWLRLALLAALLAGGAWAGWRIESWREGAARAATLNAELTQERALRAASEKARLALAAERERGTAAVQAQIKKSLKHVPLLLRDSRDCDLSDELVGVLNRARGYDLPGAGRPAAASAAEAAAAP